MPCMKCSNGKWKYGERGACQFDTLAACKAAAAAIHIKDEMPLPTIKYHDDTCMCASCVKPQSSQA
jgi:hypothetical protein